ncbi:MAG: hypothetical protein EPN22_04705 [Nitrospirae bacterium]|nr:MAG: hypothetical protein EPN22_04705 [Nitrospirota bacterium]
MGWLNKPLVDGEIRVSKHANEFFHRRHNNQGLRMQKDTAYEKPAGIRRILLIGDSFFWGYGVNDKEVISEVLQNKFGKGVEALNGSVTGYGTDQELLWLTEEGLKYKPDIVVLGFFPYNDIEEIAASIIYGYPKPFFNLEGGRLMLKNVPVPDTRETRRKGFEEPTTLWGRLKKFLRHNTHIYPFAASRLNSNKTLRQFFIDTGIAEEYTWDLPGVAFYKLSDKEKAMDLSDALLLELRKVSEGAGAKFLLVFIPRKESLAKSSGDNVTRGVREWNDNARRYLKDFTSEHKLAFIDLLPVLRSYNERGVALYHVKDYDNHWNAEGHRIAAEEIFNSLKQRGWLLAGE